MFDETTYNVYDDTLLTLNSGSSTGGINNGTFILGHDTTVVSAKFIIDELIIWDHPLSQDQIRNLVLDDDKYGKKILSENTFEILVS